MWAKLESISRSFTEEEDACALSPPFTINHSSSTIPTRHIPVKASIRVEIHTSTIRTKVCTSLPFRCNESHSPIGQSFTYFLQLFTPLPSSEKSALWTFKRPQLVAATWTRPGFAPLTVQRGFWYSSHENWGWLQLPYLDLPFMKNLFTKMERVRTCDSQSKSLPGMFASINNSTDANGEIIGCESFPCFFCNPV